MNITIVGAGVIGCAIAHELASRGACVRVLDGRGPGGGATRASAGILAPHIEGHLPTLHALGVRSLGMYDAFIDRVVRDGGQAVEYERAGTLQVALSGDEAGQLAELAGALSGAGVDHVLLDGDGVRVLEPSVTTRAVAGLQIHSQGYVAAHDLTRALAAAALRFGATLETSGALSVNGGETPAVNTATGPIDSDAVVVAAGSWSATLEGVCTAPHTMKPIRGQLLQLRLRGRPAERVVWGSQCYLVPRRDGVVLAGATVEDVGFDERATTQGVEHLLHAAREIMPVLGDATFEEVRVGLRPMTGDELPVVGASSTMRNVFYATGHYRNGVLLAPLTARLVADLVLDGTADDDLALLRPERFGL